MKKVYILAAIAALITAVLFFVYLRSLDQQEEAPLFPVITAVSDIPAYTPITADMVQESRVELGSRHPLALSDISGALGLVSDSVIYSGEQILSTRLHTLGVGEDGLSYLVTEGMRAVTISVDRVSGLAGFLRANDRVDVLVTIDLPQPVAEEEENQQERREATTLVVAENLRILAVGTSLKPQTKEDGSPMDYDVVTLLAEAQTAEKVIFAAAEGRVSLLLRSVLDDSESRSPQLDRYDLMSW